MSVGAIINLRTTRYKITFWPSMEYQNKGFYQLADEPKGEECTDVSYI